MKTFNEHRETFVHAFYGTSFSPEKRAEQYIEMYDDALVSFKSEISKAENSGELVERFISKVLELMSKRSRIMSTMITGPANFPAEANRKKMGYYENACQDFDKWVEKVTKSVNREPRQSYAQQIATAFDSLEQLENNQHEMKRINKLVKLKSFNTNDYLEIILNSTLDKDLKEEASSFFERFSEVGFKAFKLKNNNAKIKNTNDRIKTLEFRMDLEKNWSNLEKENIVVSVENDRVVIKNENKPSAEQIKILKSNGFKWSPSSQSWVRQLTYNAIRSAKIVFESF